MKIHEKYLSEIDRGDREYLVHEYNMAEKVIKKAMIDLNKFLKKNKKDFMASDYDFGYLSKIHQLAEQVKNAKLIFK